MPKYLPQLFRQQPGFFNYIEGLRALAGIWVIIFHMAMFAALFVPKAKYHEFLQYPPFTFAYSSCLSIDIFFVISGFVIGYSLMREYQRERGIRFARFFFKRFARIYPLYIVILILNMPIAFHQLGNIWTNLLQINNHLSRQNQYLAWTWSIAVDFQFYALFSGFLWLAIKNKLRPKTIIILASLFFVLPLLTGFVSIFYHQFYRLPADYLVVTSPAHIRYVDTFYDRTYIHSSPLFLGTLTAYIMLYQKDQLQNIKNTLSTKSLNLISGSIAIFILWCFMNDPIWFVHQHPTAWQTSTFWAVLGQRTLFSLLLCALILLTDQPRGWVLSSWHYLLSNRIWRPFAQLTYSTFLLHPTIILFAFLFYATHHPNMTVQEYMNHCLWVFGAIYLIAIPFYLYIEQPCAHALKNKWLYTSSGVLHDNERPVAT